MGSLGPQELAAIAPIADRQVKQWVLALQAAGRPSPAPTAALLAGDVRPYVSISREAGAGGSEIGGLVATRLGCDCLDNQVLRYVAERYGTPEALLGLVDERVAGGLYETFRLWFDARSISQDEYVTQLGQLAALAAHQHSVVFVGRGIQFLLPRDRGLAVRIVAPLDQRIARTMDRRKLDREAAATFIRDTDDGRAFFVRRHFHADVADPSLYDLVVSMARLDGGAVADLIAQAFRSRFG
jgi:cytidylate kinase